MEADKKPPGFAGRGRGERSCPSFLLHPNRGERDERPPGLVRAGPTGPRPSFFQALHASSPSSSRPGSCRMPGTSWASRSWTRATWPRSCAFPSPWSTSSSRRKPFTPCASAGSSASRGATSTRFYSRASRKPDGAFRRAQPGSPPLLPDAFLALLHVFSIVRNGAFRRRGCHICIGSVAFGSRSA